MSDAVVWKHKLRDEVNDVQLPVGAEVLHVAEQQGQIMLWERHGADETAIEDRRFRVAGTGHPFPDGGKHVGSLLTTGGFYVFHVFEEDRT